MGLEPLARLARPSCSGRRVPRAATCSFSWLLMSGRAAEAAGEAGASLGPCMARGDGEQEASGSPPLGRRRVQFLLPSVTMQGPPPPEEERAFFQRVEHLLGPAKGDLEPLFAADGWEDLLEEKSVRKLPLPPPGSPGRGGGGGCRPQPGQEVTVRLLGVLGDGSLVERDPRLSFVPGQGDVVQAVELAVLSMQRGEVALILTRPAYAYGHLGRPPDIPEEAPLLYQVALLGVRESPDPALLPAAERLSRGHQKRERGNFHFEREDYQLALRSYQLALRILPSPGARKGPPPAHQALSAEGEPSGPEPGGRGDKPTEGLQEEEDGEEEALRQLRVKCLNNCAATQLKLQLREEAGATCDEALLLDPNNPKALYWKGKLLAELGEDQAATEILRRALQLEPAAKAVHAELSRLARRQRDQQDLEKDSPGGLLGP